MAFEDSDIYQAILDGDLEALGCSVRQQDVNLRDYSGKSYLHICIELGQQELVKYLAQNVFLAFRDDNGHTALDLATRYQMMEVERQLIRRVTAMQDSDDVDGLQLLFQAGWRAWPSLKPQDGEDEVELTPGYQCQMDILKLQKEVDEIHWAVYHGHLPKLRQALTESLVLAADQTGLPPLQKAVLFEWLSITQYITCRFPKAVNQPDHMGRTALHYAAAFHEYQDNIMYKQLIRAGAKQDVTDLVGFMPVDFLRDASLFSIERMREEVKSRLNRLLKDYSNYTSYEESRSAPSKRQGTKLTSKRWKAVASMTLFAHSSKKPVLRRKSFEETKMYEFIMTNDVHGVRYLLNRSEDMSPHSLEGWSYLHLAVAHHVSPSILSLLLDHISPAERDCDGLTPLDLTLSSYKNSCLTEVFLNDIVGLMLRGNVATLQGLAQDGWQYWPGEQYVSKFLQHELMPQMAEFLSNVRQFTRAIQDIHKVAIMHKEVDGNLSPLLDSVAGVASLDSVGLSLAHICVIFYNIKLLNHVLHNFPFIANLKDSVGRTPLHYAAGLDDEDYMYTMLSTANSRDTEEDLWGMRPTDYSKAKNRIVSPIIQEMIRDKLHNPLELNIPWPKYLLAAKMESSKLYEAIKANDMQALENLLADPTTDVTLRDAKGRGFLHHAILTAAELPMIKALIEHTDIAVIDEDFNTIQNVISSVSYPDNSAVQEAVDNKVRELILGKGKEGEAKRLIMAGWSNWPITVQEAKEKSEDSAQLLQELMQIKNKVAEVHKAVSEGHINEVENLLDNEIFLNAADLTGIPPLHKAVLFQQNEIVHFIVSKFSNCLNIRDNMLRTALHYAAAMRDDGKLYKALTDAGANETITDLIGKTPQHYQQQPDDLHIPNILKKLEKILCKPVIDSSNKSFEIHFKAQQIQCVSPVPIRKPDSLQALLPTTIEGKYLARHLGTALTLVLAEVIEKRPWDPIEYIGQWLYKYRKNMDETAQKQQQHNQIYLEEKCVKEEEPIKPKLQEEDQQIKEEEQ